MEGAGLVGAEYFASTADAVALPAAAISPGSPLPLAVARSGHALLPAGTAARALRETHSRAAERPEAS